MNKFDVISRYGDKYQAILIDENTIHFYINEKTMIRSGLSDDNRISFVDPSGGPFIALWEYASDVLHPDLPAREITEIDYKDDHYVIKLQEKKKGVKEKVKRKPKMGRSSILKPGKSIRK